LASVLGTALEYEWSNAKLIGLRSVALDDEPAPSGGGSIVVVLPDMLMMDVSPRAISGSSARR